MEEKKNGFVLPVVNTRLEWDSALFSDKPIQCPGDAMLLVGSELIGMTKEMACVIFCDVGMVPICVATVGMGTQGTASISIRDIVQIGVLSNATGVVIIHNHPDTGLSGKSLAASKEDIQMTEYAIKACGLVGMHVYDSIIVSGYRQKFNTLPAYYSMRLRKFSIFADQYKPDRKRVPWEVVKEKDLQWDGGKDIIPEYWHTKNPNIHISKTKEDFVKVCSDMKAESSSVLKEPEQNNDYQYE